VTWDCACGATGVGTAYCPWCGRWAPAYAPAYPQQHSDPYRDPLRVERRGGGIGTVVAGAVAATVLLVAAVGAIALAGTSRGTATPGAARAHVQARAHSAAFDRRVAELEEYVAREHGAAFTGPVTIKILSDDDFVDQVLRDDRDDPFSDTLTGLGLSGGADPDDVRQSLLASRIVGLYDHLDDVLYVREDDDSPYARLILVHELTHAWQDQQYDLHSVWGRAESADAGRAVRALIEGDAKRIEHRWLAAQPESVQAALRREFGDGADSDASVAERSATALLTFSYTYGERFVNAVAAHGGNAAVTAAFHDPPVSTEQVLHPETFARGDVPQRVSVPLPPDGEQPLDANVLGEAGIALFASHGLVGPAALAAVDGWDGDAYSTWRTSGGLLCTQDDVAMESTAARDRLLAYVRRQPLGDGGHAEVVSARKLSFTSCAHP
jgi:hypothetical protein